MKTDTEEGRLAGMTLFRFAHGWRDKCSGGIEQYLGNLNKSLLERNKMTIIQMYKTEDPGSNIDVEYIGKGKLIWAPSIIKKNKHEFARDWKKIKSSLTQKMYNFTVSNRISSFIANHLFSKIISNYYRNHTDNSMILNTFNKYEINLIVFHWIADDSEAIIEKAMQSHIPFIIVNHFDNQRYNMFSMKRQILKASGFAGVSSINIPKYLRGKFLCLFDGIDTDFFDPEKAHPLNNNFHKYCILLPSRITPGKGHTDAMRAIALLNEEGIDVRLLFAGICNSQAYIERLKTFIAKLGLKNKVTFLGQLNIEDLRDYYAASDIVILPSYSEGLGRVLLEAQAMGKPVVAYATGGIPEAMQDGKTGYLVRKGDYRALAMRIKEILTNEQLKAQMGISARDLILSKFNFGELIKRHENFYLQALSKKKH